MPVDLPTRPMPHSIASIVDDRVRRRALLGALAAAAAAAVAAAVATDRFGELRERHDALAAWSGGSSLYGRGGAVTDPPFAVLTSAPLSLWPMWLSALLSAGVALAALVFCVRTVLRHAAVRRGDLAAHGAVVTAAAVAGALALAPVRHAIGAGGLGLVTAALILADLGASTRGRRWAGVGIGLAAAAQLAPVLFIVHLAATRRWRAAATAAGTAAGATGLAVVLAPSASAAYWGGVLWGPAHGASIADPSLAGLLARLYESERAPLLLWAAFGSLLLVLGLTRAHAADRAGDPLAGFALVGLTAVLIGPGSWPHHLVWIVPAIAVLAGTAACSRSRLPAVATVAAYAVFAAVPLWSRTVGTAASGPGALAANLAVLVLITMVAALPHVEARRRRRIATAPAG